MELKELIDCGNTWKTSEAANLNTNIYNIILLKANDWIC